MWSLAKVKTTFLLLEKIRCFADARCTGYPSYVDVGDLDLFRDEDITLAQRLSAAGVPVEFHLWTGAYHASELFAPKARLSQQIWATRYQAIRRMAGLAE